MNNKNIYQTLATSLKKHWLLIVLLMILEIVFSIATGIAFTEVIRRITDAIWNHQINTLNFVILALLVIEIIAFACRLLSGKLTYVLSMKLDFELEDEIYQRYINRDSWSEKDKEDMFGRTRKIVPETSKQLVGKITNDWRMFISIVSGIAYGMIELNPFIIGLCVILTVCMLLFMKKPLAKIKPEFQKIQGIMSNRFNKQMEFIENREAGIFLRPEKAVEPYINESNKFIKSILTFKKLSNGAHMFSQFGTITLVILAGFFGGTLVVRGEMSFADLLATLILIPSLASCVFAIPSMISGWRQLKGQMDSLDEIMNLFAYDYNNKETLKEQISHIHIKNLKYGYDENEVFSNITMDFKSGLYCICGPSGCGKSTLLKLMARVIPYDKGSIIINDKELNLVSRKEYWNHITYIEQKFSIFPDSLRKNIIMNLDDNKVELDSVINIVGLNKYVSTNLNDIDTLIDSSKLSSGENLKIGIARALYMKREVLFLDEVTEALDPASESLVARILRKTAQENNSIIICISHRDAIAKEANQVIFMQQGTICEVATHDELINKNNDYKNLWNI